MRTTLKPAFSNARTTHEPASTGSGGIRRPRRYPPPAGWIADITTAKIARAHLNEFPDYYTRLAKMEAEAEADGADQGE
jgi:Protein of unknown function (DUF5661)